MSRFFNIKINTKGPAFEIAQSHWRYRHTWNIKIQLIGKLIEIGRRVRHCITHSFQRIRYQDNVRHARDLFGEEAGKSWDKT